MMFLRKQPEENVLPVATTEPEKKLTKKEKLKLKKLQKRQKLLEKRRDLLRQHLTRELKYGVYTHKKHERSWKQMLIDITLPQLKEKVEFTWYISEHLIDIKDYIISNLMDEVRQQEDQNLASIVNHVTTIDRMIDMMKEQLKTLHENYLAELQSLTDQHKEFLQSIQNTCGTSINYLKEMMYGMEIETKERERNLRADMCSKIEFEIEDKQGATMEVKEKLALTLRNMVKNTNELLENFFTTTRERLIGYDYYKAADDKAQNLLLAELKKIQYLNVLIKKLRKKEEDIGHNELTNLYGEKNFYKKSFLVLKLKLADDLKLDKSKHEFFIGEFYKAHENIKKFLKRGENMIYLLRAAKKLETSEEKARPYPVFENIGDNIKDSKLFLFWQRMGKIEISRTALYEERSALLIENNLLRSQIEDLCYCLSCPKLPPICRKEGSIPFTDGLTLMRKYAKKKGVKRR
ncbi:uncharacterized protein LOC123674702 [Harmonia axyridis]|uniref:uncharacterized protein LOC123674702 n=1 Tax=Harmonia axyridis TaxID=115357 RepID=UPI001E276CCE|nr:uncharacterized protein LOC123674702 [Harmonia axyridis]